MKLLILMLISLQRYFRHSDISFAEIETKIDSWYFCSSKPSVIILYQRRIIRISLQKFFWVNGNYLGRASLVRSLSPSQNFSFRIQPLPPRAYKTHNGLFASVDAATVTIVTLASIRRRCRVISDGNTATAVAVPGWHHQHRSRAHIHR